MIIFLRESKSNRVCFLNYFSDVNGRKNSHRRDSRLDESGFIDDDTSFSVRKPSQSSLKS